MDLTGSWYDTLDGGSAHRKAARYLHRNNINAVICASSRTRTHDSSVQTKTFRALRRYGQCDRWTKHPQKTNPERCRYTKLLGRNTGSKVQQIFRQPLVTATVSSALSNYRTRESTQWRIRVWQSPWTNLHPDNAEWETGWHVELPHTHIVRWLLFSVPIILQRLTIHCLLCGYIFHHSGAEYKFTLTSIQNSNKKFLPHKQLFRA
jgi:hypothetical protein